tara:strand:- start:41 stop:340 length:300 start_codon:yes stop_codon:yes gene_type:complete
MKEKYTIKHTPYGQRVYTEYEDGSVSSIQPLMENTCTLYVLSEDPSNYTEGQVFNTLNEAQQAKKAKEYIFELHYPNLDKGTLPCAIFVYSDGKRVRII